MLVRMTIKPNARQNAIIIEADGGLKVKIKAPPVDGKANKYLIEFLATTLKIPKSYISIIKGETASHKTLEINITEQAFWQQLKS